MKFCFKTIDEMTGYEAFCVERLRNEVFVSEQKITLPEIDDEDFHAIHVFSLNDGKDDDFELQLDGGEPLLHTLMFLFML